ncbi:MAG TPA: hypothetical protein VEY91_10640 [Candidatus Limnocylindria bacterium]|nr:hypothetical protein [Candidatus Limnocylindria bacterium]
MRPRCWFAVAALVVLIAARSAAQSLEPPPEVPDGEDYTADPADSLGEGQVELGVAASGREGSAPSRRRRVRYEGDGVSASVRDGSGDPLAGGVIEGRAAAGVIRYGRLAPRWGRGLVLGSAAEPWRAMPLDRGARAAFRGRSGEGVSWSRGAERGLEALYGRFTRRDLFGVRARERAIALGVLADRRGAIQPSLALAVGRTEGELAFDERGRWRAEGTLERPLGDWVSATRVRAGAEGFKSLGEPIRSGPARALTLGLAGNTPIGNLDALAALWRFQPGVAGARLGLELKRAFAGDRVLVIGFGEQHGARRPAPARPGGFRQGGWVEWRGVSGPLGVGLRHETWGRRAWGRGLTRSVTGVGLEVRAGVASLRLAHSVYRSSSGETLYLPEVLSDRLVLRALTGEGERTRLEARLPVAGGRVRAALDLTHAAARSGRTQWTLDWSRRARSTRARGGG